MADGGVQRVDYDARALDQGWPSSAFVVAAHGSWVAAHGRTARGLRLPATTPGQALNWLRRYLTETPGPWTYRGLYDWLQAQPGAPSGTTIRNQLGGWAHALRRLQHQLAAGRPVWGGSSWLAFSTIFRHR